MNTGDRIKDLRILNNLTQEELGFSYSTFTDWIICTKNKKRP